MWTTISLVFTHNTHQQPPEPDIPDYNVFPIIALFFCSVANL